MNPNYHHQNVAPEIPMEQDDYDDSSDSDFHPEQQNLSFEGNNQEQFLPIQYIPSPSPSPNSSINSDTSQETVQIPSPVPPPSYPRVITSLDDFPEIVIDNLNLDTVPNQHYPLQFFITKCTPEILAPLFTGEFLDTLWYSSCWKLYVSEIIYGFISYAINSQRNPFTGSICTETVPGFIEKLHRFGKIVVIKEDEIEDVHLTEGTICDTDCVCVQVTCTQVGVLSHAINFSIYKTEHTTITSSTIGTIINQDLILGGRYPTHPFEKGFPLREMISSTIDNEVKTFYRLFSTRLNRLRQLIATYPRTHYEILFNDTDKLVDLWYLKHLSDHFNTKIHVTPLYHKFVMEYVPKFADCFSTTNISGTCRFHYDCAQVNNVESCLSRRAFNAFRINPGSLKMNTIWVGSRAQVPEDVALFFIHKGDEFYKSLD